MNVVVYDVREITVTDDKGNDITKQLINCVPIMHNIDGTVHISADDYILIKQAINKANMIDFNKSKLTKSQLQSLKRKQAASRNILYAIEDGYDYMTNIGAITDPFGVVDDYEDIDEEVPF